MTADTLVNAAQDNRKFTEVIVLITMWKGMVTLGNRGQDDRYIRLWPRNILLPAVSRSCDCHVVQQRSVSQYLLQSWMKEVMVLTANNPSGKRKEGIIVLCLVLFSTFARETLILRCVIIVDVFSHQGGWCIFNLLSTDSPASSTSEELSSTAPKKKNSRWTETEEKILIELFGDNEDKLRYKAYNLPEWESIATQLHERCRREHVSSDKTAQQCKTKMSNLTKKYKTTKDKLLTTGYEKGGDEEADKEAEGGVELVSKHFQDMDEILGKREAINPQHVLECSSPRSNHRVP